MKEIANALTVSAYGQLLATDVPEYQYPDTEQGFWYLEHPGKTDRKLTNRQEQDLYSIHAFINLGQVAAMRYFKQWGPIRHDNPKIKELNDVFATLLPELEQPLPSNHIDSLTRDVSPAELGLPRMFIRPILLDPSLRDELQGNWAIATDIYRSRAPIAFEPESSESSSVDFYTYHTLNIATAGRALNYALQDLQELAKNIRK